MLPKQVSSICAAGHCSNIDNQIIVSYYSNYTFVAKEALRKMPVIGFAMQAVGAFFINRGADEKERELIV
jgi:1-acyl-sn-glycerol-3-phosphate acyltransferase